MVVISVIYCIKQVQDIIMNPHIKSGGNEYGTS